MEIQEILENKNNFIKFLKSKGLNEETDYIDKEYKEGTYFKISKRKLLVVYEVVDKEKIKEIKNHFLIDKGLSYCVIVLDKKIIFFRNFGEKKHFLYSERTKDKVSKIDRLKKIDEEGFDYIFQAGKDISAKFYESFKVKRNLLVKHIENEIAPTEKFLISQKIFDRFFFIYFLCHKEVIKFKDGGKISGENLFSRILLDNKNFLENLKKLFHLFNSQEKEILKIKDYEIVVPYLNEGLFRPDVLEQDLEISLKKKDWKNIFDFLNSYHWIIEDVKVTEENEDKILTPEILGHVYERSVVEWEQKGFEKEVEEAAGISERKKKGVYYTPEEITDYISTNTIIPYLLDNLNKDFESFEELIEKGSKQDWKEAIEIISEIRILDPACGSGAFLIKASEVLYNLKRRLLYKLKNNPNFYNLKLEIITDNIYGVDILAGAIEISKLRLWLWLIEDFDESKGKIQALPNIEYNLKVGNSLIGWVDEKLSQMPMNTPLTKEVSGIFQGLIAYAGDGDTKDLEKARKLLKGYKLENYIEAYYILYKIYRRAHGIKAQNLKEILKTIRKSIYQTVTPAFLQHVNNKIKPNHDNKKPPITREEFNEIQPFHWRIDFGHIIKEGGFDVILANPPYVSKHSKENVSKASKATIFSKYETAYKDSDLYCYFFERSNSLTSKESYISMITSNTFFVSVFGSPLRSILADKDIKSIIDFKEFRVFEDASNYVQIMIYRNKEVGENDFYCAKPLYSNPDPIKNNFSEKIENIEKVLREKYADNRNIEKHICPFEYKQSYLKDRVLLNDEGKKKLLDYSTTKGSRIKKKVPYSDIWVFLPENLMKLHDKIDKVSKRRLNECKVIYKNKFIKDSEWLSEGIFVGIATSGDNVYVVKSKDNINIDNWKEKNKLKVHCQRDDKEFEIETGILKAFIKPDMLNKYNFNWKKSFVIFPYDKNAKLLKPKYIKKEFPKAWRFLTSKRTLNRMCDISKDRKKIIDKLKIKLNVSDFQSLEKKLRNGKINKLSKELLWYKYMRVQNINRVDEPKILTKTVSNKNSFSLDPEGLLAPHNVGVYSIPLKKSEFMYTLAILNSKFKCENLNELSRKLRSIEELDEKLLWYKYIYPKNLASVNKPKILTKTVSNKNSFSLDPEGLLTPHNVGVYSIPLKKSEFMYTLAILNSKLCEFYLTSFLPDKRGGYYMYIKEYLSRIPIPKISKSKQKPFIKLVDEILSITKDDDYLENEKKQKEVKKLQDKIDKLVYDLYDLTDEEIKVVEEFNEDE